MFLFDDSVFFVNACWDDDDDGKECCREWKCVFEVCAAYCAIVFWHVVCDLIGSSKFTASRMRKDESEIAQGITLLGFNAELICKN